MHYFFNKWGYLVLGILFSWGSHAQMPTGVFSHIQENQGNSIHHELKIKGGYFVHSVYGKSPARFIKTLGGFCTAKDGVLAVQLEFNSNHGNDGVTELHIPYSLENDMLTLDIGSKMSFARSESETQDLDGQWLFATRGPDQGQERRGDENPRKTLKFLIDGHFQWIAYHTENFKFSGTGGGNFTSTDGVYTENITYFSRDNSRVGATLRFNYELKGDDWHHKGKNSKGEPMYEIWAKRK